MKKGIQIDEIHVSQALDLFATDGFLIVNNKLLQIYGPNTAVFLSNLISKYKYFLNSEGGLLNGEWFYMKHKYMTEQMGLGLTSLRTCKELLKKDGIIETKMKGVPPVEFYKINLVTLINRVFAHSLENLTNKGKESLQLKVRKPNDLPLENLTNNISNIKHNKIKSNNIKSNTTVAADKKITNSLFDDFWKLYPRHVDLGKAKKKWQELCNKAPKDKPTWREIKRAIILQKKSERWQEKQFIPHPTTWLNNMRWLDDPAEMQVWDKKEEKPNTPGFTLGKISNEDEEMDEYTEYTIKGQEIIMNPNYKGQ